VNLLDNAVKHSPPEAPVRLSGGVGGGRVHVRVTDRGRGIPLSRRGQVFEPFFRGRGSEGSGLGLTICRGFTEANGGSIRIDDAAEGGTSISVSFPLAPEPSRA
jgi:two-component system sensor histidine kinase KdpD